MGAGCTVCKSDGDTYDLTLGNNRIAHTPIEGTEKCQQSCAEAAVDNQAKTTSNNHELEETSSSKDVNVHVLEENKPKVLEESQHEVKEVQQTFVSDSAKMDEARTTKEAVKGGHSSSTQQNVAKLGNMKEDEANAVVMKCWEKIETSCDSCESKTSQDIPSVLANVGWRVVRLFVSSTFTDYHAERELLVKKVNTLNLSF